MPRADDRPPPLRLLVREAFAIGLRLWRSIGPLEERGPEDGLKLMVLPGFLASDHTTLGLQRALAAAGYRVSGWGMGMNRGATPDMLERIVDRIERFGGGEPIILVGWSLGGVFAREVAKLRPDLTAKVVTLGAPFSGDPRCNNVWRLYEMVSGHPVDQPPLKVELGTKPPVPTLAIWSRKDGVVAPACARGAEDQSDRRVEVDSSHMGFGVSARAWPSIIAAIRDF